MNRAYRWVSSIILGATLLAGLLPIQSVAAQSAVTPGDTPTNTPIKHFIVLMQENHTFDNYFGTYPGVDGIPKGISMPVDPTNPNNTEFVSSFHIGNMAIKDLSHSFGTFREQYDNGKMDGFVYASVLRKKDGRLTMGYYDGTDLPYYWNIADNFVLFDRYFSSARNGSYQNHMYWVAGAPPAGGNSGTAYLSGNNDIPTIFDKLEAKGISWKFYVQNYDPSINYRNLNELGNRASQVLWVPLLTMDRFLDNPLLSKHIVDLSEYFVDLKNGTLPSVAYITPSGASEHPPGSLQSGQRFVKTLIQELMRSPYWDSSAFLWSYDDWGGWYDHVVPPQVDSIGYGFRVPALMVSAYARKGYIDSTQLDFSSDLKFIEQNWNIQPLAARDAQSNSILEAFDFKSPPRQATFISMDRTPPAPAKSTPVWVIYTFYALAGLLSIVIIALAVRKTLLGGNSGSVKIPTHQVRSGTPYPLS
jgi:phospholipase C